MESNDMAGWSGMFLEDGDVGYMEISNADERFHRPPPGWTLVSINYNIFDSSEIFRYIKADAADRI